MTQGFTLTSKSTHRDENLDIFFAARLYRADGTLVHTFPKVKFHSGKSEISNPWKDAARVYLKDAGVMQAYDRTRDFVKFEHEYAGHATIASWGRI